MGEFVNELTQTQTKESQGESSPSEKESRLISAYQNAAKIKSSVAQKVFLDRFIPEMEAKLGLVDFISNDVKEIIKEDPLQATNIVELMKNAQRKMKAEVHEKKAFNPSVEPLHVGRVREGDLDLPDTRPVRTVSKSSQRIQAAVKVIKNRVKDLKRLTPQSLDILRAVLSDDFSDEEIEQVFYLLGVR